MPERPQRLRLASMGLLVLALLGVATALPAYLSYFCPTLNSDHLLLPDIYASLVDRGEHWASWSMGGSLYFFPDIAVQFPIAALVGAGHRSYVLQTGLWIVLLWTGFYLIGRVRVGGETRGALGWFLVLFLLATHPGVWLQSMRHWQLLHQPTIHGGTYLTILASLLLVFLQLRQGRRWHLVLLASLCMASTVSDPLYCLYFTLPSLVSLVSLAFLQRGFRKPAKTLVLSILAPTALARLALPWLLPHSHAESQYISQLGPRTAWRTARFVVSDLLSTGQWVLVGSMLLSFAAAGWLLWALIGMIRGRRPFSWSVFTLDMSAVVALAIGWAALLATGNYVGSACWRYIVFPSALVIILALWAAAPRLPRWAGALGLLLFGVLALGHGFSIPKLETPYSPLARFLDDQSQTEQFVALAGYWTARQTTFQSRTGTRVEQIHIGGQVMHWANSLEPYRRIVRDSARTVLVILDGLDAQKIRAAYGTPTSQQTIDGGGLIYRYDPPSAKQVVRFLASTMP